MKILAVVCKIIGHRELRCSTDHLNTEVCPRCGTTFGYGHDNVAVGDKALAHILSHPSLEERGAEMYEIDWPSGLSSMICTSTIIGATGLRPCGRLATCIAVDPETDERYCRCQEHGERCVNKFRFQLEELPADKAGESKS